MLIGGDFNYALQEKIKAELLDLLEDFKAQGISFSIHTPVVGHWDAAHAWYETTVAARKAADIRHAAQLAVGPVQQVQAAYVKSEEARYIRDAIKEFALSRKLKHGGQIDFICTLGLKEQPQCGSAPFPSITCASRASHMTVFGGFDHSPLVATVKMACAASGAAIGYTGELQCWMLIMDVHVCVCACHRKCQHA